MSTGFGCKNACPICGGYEPKHDAGCDLAAALSPPAGAGAAGLDDHFAVVRNAAVALAQRAGQCPAVDGLIAESGTACGALSAEFRALRATLARQAADLERLRAVEEWQPIETAPHATEVILGWWHTGFRGEAPEWRSTIDWASGGERVGSYSSIWHHGSATHWRPLPAAPALAPDRGSEVRPEGGGEGGAVDGV